MDGQLEQIIRKYKKQNPFLGFFDLGKIFGLPAEDIIEIIGHDNYEIYPNDMIRVKDNNNRNYHVERWDGFWARWIYNTNGTTLAVYKSNGSLKLNFHDGFDYLYTENYQDLSFKEIMEEINLFIS